MVCDYVGCTILASATRGKRKLREKRQTTVHLVNTPRSIWIADSSKPGKQVGRK